MFWKVLSREEAGLAFVAQIGNTPIRRDYASIEFKLNSRLKEM